MILRNRKIGQFCPIYFSSFIFLVYVNLYIMQQGKVFRIVNSGLYWADLRCIADKIQNPVCIFGRVHGDRQLWYLIDFYGRFDNNQFIFIQNEESRPFLVKLDKMRNCLFKKHNYSESKADIIWYTPSGSFINALILHNLDAVDIKISLKSVFK